MKGTCYEPPGLGYVPVVVRERRVLAEESVGYY